MAGTDYLKFVMGLKLRSLRNERGWSLSRLAELAGLSISYLSEIEKGKKYPKPDKLLALAEALQVEYDELVSLKVDEELGPLKALFGSPLLREFPFDLFGVEPEDLFQLVTEAPEKAGALVRAFLEVGRTYDVQVEHFLLAALRSYQQLNHNHFAELEEEAAAFRAGQGWERGKPVPPAALRAVLEREHGYRVDEETLGADPVLGSFRSVFRDGERPVLFVNGRLLPSQRAFVLAREIGYRHLRLGERAVTSSWIEVESFEQVLNNFKASYFAGAVLIDGESLRRRLEELFARPVWDGEALLECMRRYDATPEMFFYRLTELVTRLFGLEEIFFLRFSNPVGSGRFDLTKVFNLSRVPVPHGIGLNEHYCRRWPAMRLLGELSRRQIEGGADAPLVAAQRSRFLEENAEFFVIAMARPLALTEGTNSSVSIGFLLDEAFRRRVRFWDDPAIPRVEVNLTCERCRLGPSECEERAAEPLIYRRQQRQERKERALAELLGG